MNSKFELQEPNAIIIKSYENYLQIKQNLKEKKIIILGGGTNILFKTQNLDYTILKVDIEGIEIIEESDKKSTKPKIIDTQKLAKIGFTPSNDFESEIMQLLIYCKNNFH